MTPKVQTILLIGLVVLLLAIPTIGALRTTVVNIGGDENQMRMATFGCPRQPIITPIWGVHACFTGGHTLVEVLTDFRFLVVTNTP